jgi:hypothetical protein
MWFIRPLFLLFYLFVGASINEPIHLVFIGDSLMRYSYLDFVYRMHFRKDPPKNLTCNDHRSTHQKWKDYLHQSTLLFNGSMVCDCFRDDSLKSAENATETRYYRHPSGKLFATLFLKLGELPMYVKKNLSEAHVSSSLSEARRNTWIDYNYQELADHVIHLEPKPTVVLLNQRYWVTPFFPETDIRPELADMMRTLLTNTQHVLWLQGTPSSRERANLRSQVPNPTDNYVRSHLCNSSHSLQSTFLHTCRFVPFPNQLRNEISRSPREYYSDLFHFRNNTVYNIRISAALKLIGLSHLYNSSFE